MLFSGHPSASTHGDHTSSWYPLETALGSNGILGSAFPWFQLVLAFPLPFPLSPISQTICGMRSSCYHGLHARREGMRKGREEGGKRGGNKDSIVISSKKLQTPGQGRMRGWGCGLPPHLCLTSRKSQQPGKKTPHSKAQPAPAPKPSA